MRARTIDLLQAAGYTPGLLRRADVGIGPYTDSTCFVLLRKKADFFDPRRQKRPGTRFRRASGRINIIHEKHVLHTSCPDCLRICLKRLL